MFSPETEGIDHVNIYSKSKLQLGRFMSNFARAPITVDGLNIKSIEGLWYYKSVDAPELMKLPLLDLYGYQAKQLGKSFPSLGNTESEEFIRCIKRAIYVKYMAYKELLEDEFAETIQLPLTHYYTFGSKVHIPTSDTWVIDHWENLRKNY